MPIPRSASSLRAWMALAASLALAASAGRVSGAELVAVSDEVTAAPDDATAAPWRIYAVSSERSQFSAGAGSLSVKLAPGDRASCSRSIGLDDPSGLVCRFNLAFAGAADGRETEQVLRVGSGFGDSNADEPDASTFGRLGIRSTSSARGFELRDLGARRSSGTFFGTQAVTWALNHTGRTVTYAAPDGTLEPLANDRMDIWVGRTKVFDEMAVTRSTAEMTDLKWFWGEGAGSTVIDHVEIVPLEDGVAGAAPQAPGPSAGPAIGGVPAAAPAASDPALELYRPSPNPFARTTRFAYAISGARERVDVGVYDVVGRRIRALTSGLQSAGRYEVAWDGRNDAGDHVRNGIYFLRASIGSDLRVARIAYLVK